MINSNGIANPSDIRWAQPGWGWTKFSHGFPG